ncbi:L-lactate utilization operon repressor, partial [Dysosmobacter welbionis]
AQHEFEQRRRQGAEARTPLLPRDVLKDIAQLVVDLQLELSEELRHGISPIKQCGRCALAPIRHDIGREGVRIRHGGVLAHAALQVLPVSGPHQTVRGEGVDIGHGPGHNHGCLLPPRLHQWITAPPVYEEAAPFCDPVALLVGPQCVPHPPQQHSPVQQGAALGQRNKVRQPGGWVDSHHICRHTALQPPRQIIEPRSSDVSFHVPVRKALLVRQQVCVFIQFHHEIA